MRSIIKSISNEIWNIGFIENNLLGVLNGENVQVRWLQHDYKNRSFADPFILEVSQNEIVVLVEDFTKSVPKGHISEIVIDRKSFQVQSIHKILELDTHLSFPVIIRDNGKVFIYPESGEGGSLNLYEYDVKSKKCEKIACLMNEAVEDAIIRHIQDDDYLFCTKRENPNGNELHIYKRNHSGQFEPYQIVTFEDNIARMAGDFFELDGKVFRPTQESNIQYGHAITLQEMSFENGRFSFKEIRRLYSPHPKLTEGMHTFNTYKGVIVTDALGFNNMWIRSGLKKINVIK